MESIWNLPGMNIESFHVESMWNPGGIHVNKYFIYVMKYIPDGIHGIYAFHVDSMWIPCRYSDGTNIFHMDSMEYLHSTWIPHGIRGEGKLLHIV